MKQFLIKATTNGIGVIVDTVYAFDELNAHEMTKSKIYRRNSWDKKTYKVVSVEVVHEI
jgi:hypothetical protein|tara:strand:- start:387 stop:563 length:177 start_codon:yes stop_codon:yes gene_type:complete